jgi:hypothetical protein
MIVYEKCCIIREREKERHREADLGSTGDWQSATLLAALLSLDLSPSPFVADSFH